MFVLFFLFWVIFNGALTLEIAIFGIVIAAALYAFICKFMDYSIQKDLFIVKKGIYILQYIGVLIAQIVIANFATIRLIFARKRPEPVIVHFKTTLKTKTARVLLANSITLTPGTITVSLEEDEYTVHCLDKSLSEGMDSSVFVRLLTRLESGYPSQKQKGCEIHE